MQKNKEYKIKSFNKDKNILIIYLDDGTEKKYNYIDKYFLYENIYSNKGIGQLCLEDSYLGNITYNEEKGEWNEDPISFSCYEYKQIYQSRCIIKKINMKSSIFNNIIISGYNTELCKIEEDIYILDSICKTITINNYSIIEEINILFNKIYGDIQVYNSTLNKRIQIQGNIIIEGIDFQGNKIIDVLTLSQQKNIGRLKLSYNEFKSILCLYCVRLENGINFKQSIFYNGIDFVNGVFNGIIDFSSAKFENDIDFKGGRFEHIIFNNMTFKYKVDLRLALCDSISLMDITNESVLYIGNDIEGKNYPKLGIYQYIDRGKINNTYLNRKKIIKSCKYYKYVYRDMIKDYNILKEKEKKIYKLLEIYRNYESLKYDEYIKIITEGKNNIDKANEDLNISLENKKKELNIPSMEEIPDYYTYLDNIKSAKEIVSQTLEVVGYSNYKYKKIRKFIGFTVALIGLISSIISIFQF